MPISYSIRIRNIDGDTLRWVFFHASDTLIFAASRADAVPWTISSSLKLNIQFQNEGHLKKGATIFSHQFNTSIFAVDHLIIVLAWSISVNNGCCTMLYCCLDKLDRFCQVVGFISEKYGIGRSTIGGIRKNSTIRGIRKNSEKIVIFKRDSKPLQVSIVIPDNTFKP